MVNYTTPARTSRSTSPADPTVDVIVRRLAERVHPELILLFGSRVTGVPQEDSDYDLMLVIADATAITGARDAANAVIRREERISADILVCSVEEYRRQQHDPGCLAFMISREGLVLYATGAVPQRSPLGTRVRERPNGEGLAMWISRAESDFRTAESLLTAPEPTWDAICFHSHACTEKLLKALIVLQGTFPPRTHELLPLLARQRPEIRNQGRILTACDFLMALHPRSRYPELPEPREDEAREALTAARDIRGWLLPWLSSSSGSSV